MNGGTNQGVPKYPCSSVDGLFLNNLRYLRYLRTIIPCMVRVLSWVCSLYSVMIQQTKVQNNGL